MYNFVKLIRSILFAAVIALTLPSKTSAEEILVIDPGHGGIFSGTCGYSGKETGFCEKDANLLVALKLKEMVEAHSDITVHMTRSEDTDFIDDLSIPIWHNDALLNDMENRMVIANGFVKGKTATSIFISIHHNQDVASENTRGTETFYYDGVNNNNPRFPPHPNQLKYLENNKRLGEITHNNLLEALGLRDRELRNDQSFFCTAKCRNACNISGNWISY
ncbi:MAG: N-acetylmuramoyl-L-alanine amidase [Bacillus sp. (in: Bacteria)]|nr:N-acetylmuramoyl-L-alanine amidase [Bacillus sp. (in: firmicutes)]